jgi:hypothetical protein
MEENQTATYFFRSMLFTYFNYNISLILATFNIKKIQFWQPRAGK